MAPANVAAAKPVSSSAKPAAKPAPGKTRATPSRTRTALDTPFRNQRTYVSPAHSTAIAHAAVALVNTLAAARSVDQPEAARGLFTTATSETLDAVRSRKTRCVITFQRNPEPALVDYIARAASLKGVHAITLDHASASIALGNNRNLFKGICAMKEESAIFGPVDTPIAARARKEFTELLEAAQSCPPFFRAIASESEAAGPFPQKTSDCTEERPPSRLLPVKLTTQTVDPNPDIVGVRKRSSRQAIRRARRNSTAIGVS